MLLLLGGYMWLFIHRPFEIWPVLGELHIERIYMIATILYWAVVADKRWVDNRMTTAFVTLAAVILGSDLFSPFGSDINVVVQDWFKVAVFYLLVITTVRSERDLKCLVAMFMGVMALYLAHSMREYLAGRHSYRMGTARMIGVDSSYSDANTFSATILYSLPLLWPLWTEATRTLHRRLLLGYLGLALSCILLTGSRSAFVGLACLTLFAIWRHKARWTALTVAVIVAPLIWMSLSPELQNRYLTLIDPSHGPKNAAESAESRGRGWRDGVKMWNEHPVLGVGAGNFGKGRGFALESHHLYGQVLGELGTLGAIAFGMVLLAFIANYRGIMGQCRRRPDLNEMFSVRLVRSITLSVALLLVMGFGGHNLFRYTWAWYAAFEVVAIGCIRQRAGFPVAAAATGDAGGAFPRINGVRRSPQVSLKPRTGLWTSSHR